MRTGQLNPFSDETRAEFIFNYNCWNCPNTGKGLEAHHIVGRGNRHSNLERCPLNLAPLCPECHKEFDGLGGKEKQDKIAFYLQKTFVYLLKQKYELTDRDKEFLIKYNKYYKTKII